MTERSADLVYIVDDDDGVRESLSALLQSVGIKTRAFATAEASMEAVESSLPACMLVDVRMPGMSGLEFQRLLREKASGVPVIILTGHGDVAMAVRAMKEGAADFLEKPFNEQQLIELVRQCRQQSLAAGLQRTRREEARFRLSRLTDREHEVLRHLVKGEPSKRIATRLGLSPKTVDVHRSNIMRKTEASSIAELVRMSLVADAPETD